MIERAESLLMLNGPTFRGEARPIVGVDAAATLKRVLVGEGILDYYELQTRACERPVTFCEENDT